MQLDTLLLSSSDLLSYNDSTFIFTLTPESAARLRAMKLETEIFCIVSNGKKILAGVFWPCYLSLGMTGFVTFNLHCSNDSNRLRIRYCLGPKDYPGEDPRKKIIIDNN